MRNIIDAIDTIVRSNVRNVGSASVSHNRINSIGEALEYFIKNAFADSFDLNAIQRLEKWNSVFSYLGNQNNPPDAMIRSGEALEIKKLESAGSEIALNSSYPKDKLYADSSTITNTCRTCEEWDVKDMIYILGLVGKQDKALHSLCMVYGVDYCADKAVYESVVEKLKNGIEQIDEIEFAQTDEIARVNRVDPLGITYLRCRGMWHIQSPLVLFKDYYSFPDNSSFSLVVVLDNEIINRLGNGDKLNALSNEFENFNVQDARIPDPNNPANLKQAKIITYYESN